MVLRAAGQQDHGGTELPGQAVLSAARRWTARYARFGPAGLENRRPGMPAVQPGQPAGAATVSRRYAARIWKEENLAADQPGTFTLCAEFPADVVGLYLDPPGAAVVLAAGPPTATGLPETARPVLPVTSAADEPAGGHHPAHHADAFLAFLAHTAEEHRDRAVHVALDRLSVRSAPGFPGWEACHPRVCFRFLPAGPSWHHRIRHWTRILAPHSASLADRLSSYTESWGPASLPFAWRAPRGGSLAAVRLIHTIPQADISGDPGGLVHGYRFSSRER